MSEPILPPNSPPLDEAAKAFLAKKTGVMIAIPNLRSAVHTQLTMWLIGLSYRTIDPECPYFFKLHMPNDLTPIEYARNECVREFLKDPFYKKLWFIDSDMLPPSDRPPGQNAIDLLQYDEPIVSGMTYIWMGGGPDEKGFYVPPRMKINAFDFRPAFDDFISKIPSVDGQMFYCDAAGSACMVIRRDVLEQMPEPWFRTIRDPYGAGLRSEDLDFCHRANAMNFRVLYVPKVQFGHVKAVDLCDVTKYGLAAMRNIINQVKAADPATMKERLPDITFSGEEPRDSTVPRTFEVIQGGKR